MNTGDKIKIFPDTDVQAYENMLHDMGFSCKRKGAYIYITDKYRYSEEDKKEFGMILSTWMKNNKINGKQLAKKLHYNASTISNWKNGKNIPNYEIKKELRELGVDI